LLRHLKLTIDDQVRSEIIDFLLDTVT